MSKESRTLALPGVLALEFTGTRPLELGTCLARAMTTPLIDAVVPGALPISDAALPSSFVNVLDDVRMELAVSESASNLSVRTTPRNAKSYGNGLPAVKLLLSLAVRHAQLRGNVVALLHGAMLALPDDDASCALLFGPSGMGKSSAASRFAAQGGKVDADDLILLYGKSPNRFFARPLPTWSRFPRGKSQSAATEREVKALLSLQRGVNDVIVEAQNPAAWQLALFQALAFHAYMSTYRREFQARSAEFLLDFAAALRQRYGAFELLGDLNGRIRDTLGAIKG